MSFIEDKKALTREKRISTLSHYNGTLESLANDIGGREIRQRIRTFSQSAYDEIIYAFRVLSKIEQSTIVIHGAIGCSASGVYFNEENPIHWYATNLNERDTILGGDEKLRRAIIRANEEQHPKVIFVVSTPVVAINNDDINAVILELEEELDVKIISIYTDGFKTKTPATGYDIVLHSLLRYVVDRHLDEKAEREDFINVVSLSENRESLASIAGILKELKIPYHILPQFSNIDEIKKAGSAKATITLNADEGAYFAEELEAVFGVKYIRTEAPIGLRGTRKFIKKLGKELGIEDQVSAYIKQKEADVEKLTNQTILKGKKVFLDLTFALAPGAAEFIEQLGGIVEGIAVSYVDLNNRVVIEKLDFLRNTVAIIIANEQPFEKANVLSKRGIDYYVSLDASPAFAMEQGSIPVSLLHTTFFGYDGVRQFVRQLEKANATENLRAFQAEKKKGLYQDSWLKKSSNWYIKQEVK